MKKITGVYIIKNLVNGKIYIGQSLNIEARWWYHKKNKSKTNRMRYVFEKYGIENFSFNVLFQVEANENIIKKILLDIMECYYIEYFNATNRNIGYNLKGGGSNGSPTLEAREKMSRAKKGRKLSEETRKKMSQAQKERIEKNGYNGYFKEGHKMFLGKHHSPETREKISLAKMGSGRGKVVSEETRKKISEAAKNRRERIEKEGNKKPTQTKEEIREKNRIYREEHKEKNKKYREEHKEELKEKNKKYREEHKEEVKERKRKYYEEHKEEIREKNKKYREEHKEEVKENKKKYREEHKEELKEKRKKVREKRKVNKNKQSGK